MELRAKALCSITSTFKGKKKNRRKARESVTGRWISTLSLVLLESRSCYVAWVGFQFTALLCPPRRVLGSQVCAITPGVHMWLSVSIATRKLLLNHRTGWLSPAGALFLPERTGQDTHLLNVEKYASQGERAVGKAEHSTY